MPRVTAVQFLTEDSLTKERSENRVGYCRRAIPPELKDGVSRARVMNSNKLSRRGFILKLGTWAGGVSAGLFAPNVFAARSGKLIGAKVSGSGDTLTVALQLDEPVKHKVFTLDAPDRVVVDLLDTRMDANLNSGLKQSPITAIRYAERDGGVRVVLELAETMTAKAQMQAVGSQNVLNITLTGSGKARSSDKKPEKPADKKPESAPKSADKPSKSEKSRHEEERPEPTPAGKRSFIVVIDPGHGGKDPGAIGRNGTREKDVVLEVARKLKARLNREKGIKALLTRESDVFIPLLDRINIAHRNKADLFISVHADASPNSLVNGSTVYILSENGASSEAARLLAESENSYDVRFGGVSINDTSNRIASVLLDLSQNAMTERSLSLANGVLSELSKVNNPLRNKVESAGFVVLKSPDIPSMLVETAFLSNPAEEKRLRTAEYQQKLANAMFKGIKRYQVAYLGGLRNA